MPVDVSTALDLKVNHDLSYAQIAAIQGVSPQAIHKRLKHLIPGEEVQSFRENRADILSGLQVKLLSQVDDARLKKLSIRDAVVSAAVLYDKERLERGMSTANLASLTSDIAAIRARKAVDKAVDK